MTRLWIRRIGLGFAALLLLMIAAAAFLIAGFDANSYKAQAIGWMKSERQRSLAIDGPIKLSVFPKLAVRRCERDLRHARRAGRFHAQG